MNQVRLMKLPLVAQDIVCAGSPRIGRLLLQDRLASGTLLSILDLPPPLDERAATRFNNVLGMLLVKAPDHVPYSLHVIGEGARDQASQIDVTPGFVTAMNPSDDPLAYKLLRHIGSEAVAETIKCLLTQSVAPALSFLPSVSGA